MKPTEEIGQKVQPGEERRNTKAENGERKREMRIGTKSNTGQKNHGSSVEDIFPLTDAEYNKVLNQQQLKLPLLYKGHMLPLIFWKLPTDISDRVTVN